MAPDRYHPHRTHWLTGYKFRTQVNIDDLNLGDRPISWIVFASSSMSSSLRLFVWKQQRIAGRTTPPKQPRLTSLLLRIPEVHFDPCVAIEAIARRRRMQSPMGEGVTPPKSAISSHGPVDSVVAPFRAPWQRGPVGRMAVESGCMRNSTRFCVRSRGRWVPRERHTSNHDDTAAIAVRNLKHPPR